MYAVKNDTQVYYYFGLDSKFGSPSAFKVKGPGFKSHEIQLRPHKVNYIVWVSTTNIIDVVIVMC